MAYVEYRGMEMPYTPPGYTQEDVWQSAWAYARKRGHNRPHIIKAEGQIEMRNGQPNVLIKYKDSAGSSSSEWTPLLSQGSKPPSQGPARGRPQVVRGRGQAAPPEIEAFLRRAGRGAGRINSRSGAKQAALAPFAGRAQANYAPAISGQQALGQALSGSLTTQGAQLGGSLDATLAGIQAPSQAVATHAGGAVATGQGAGQAMGALSSADLERLRSSQSAESIYAAALPRLAQLAGAQELRGFMASAQDELADLSLRAAADAAASAREEREWSYRVRQDALDRRRQRTLDQRALGETRYERRQDRIDRQEQARRDRMAQIAAAQEYGLDVADLQLDQRSQAEKERAARTREGQAAQRERRQAQKDARSAAGGDAGNERADYFYEVREDAFGRAREYAKTQQERRPSNRISRQTAQKRLMAEFGQALIGRGYSAKAVRQMIARALDASGY